MSLTDYDNKIKELRTQLNKALLSQQKEIREQIEYWEDAREYYIDNLTEDDEDW